MREEEITFKIGLDDNQVPETLSWSASDGAGKPATCEACLISIWDPKEQSALRIDLWTKEMKVDEMKLLIHQTIATMADTYMRATNDEALAQEIKAFSATFAEKAKLYEDKQ
ncbi:MAG: gliding motility protein GldC [Flavobacteriales bacterium]